MEKKKTIIITQRRKANLYVVMGILLIVVTVIWAHAAVVPKEIIATIGIAGFIPVIVMLMFDHEPMNKESLRCWKGALSSTVLMLMILLMCFWVFICMCKIIKPVEIDVCYMIPCLAGATYILIGDNYKTYEDHLNEIDE